MKPDGDSLSHACHMIRGHVTMLVWQLAHADCYCDGLHHAAEAGCFLHPETIEARQLGNNVKELRRLASELEALRARLIANTPMLQAAE